MAAIKDFGEKIDGAKKDRWRLTLDRMMDVPDDDIQNQTMTKAFPEPNFKALLKEGADPWIVAFIRSAREMIPSKPRRGLGLWAENVARVRNMCREVLEDPDAAQRVKDKLHSAHSDLSKKLAGPISLYLSLGHDYSLKGLDVEFGIYRFADGKVQNPPLERWDVTRQKTKGRYGKDVIASGSTAEEAMKAAQSRLNFDRSVKTKKPMKFKIYSYRNNPGTYFIGRKVGANTVDVKKFDTVAAAQEYKRNHHDDLVEAFDKMKQVQQERRPDNRPRTGYDLRDGRDVTPEEFDHAFGFRGVQFGNYVEDKKRQGDLNQAWDALHDLAEVMGCTTRDLSLNGTLALAFGARGSGGVNPAAAHYEPVEVVINLTKKSGAGSLAHEWFHAIDNHIGKKIGGRLDYATTAQRPRAGEDASKHRAEREMMTGITQALRDTDIGKRSRILDRTRSTPYWGTTIEIAARAFEAYVIDRLADRGVTNDYLANIVDEDMFKAESALMGLEGERYPYPTAGEMDVVREAFNTLYVPGAEVQARPLSVVDEADVETAEPNTEDTEWDVGNIQF